MSYYDIPERPLDPPEDRRKRVYGCALCKNDILEGDDYYDIGGVGPCCETCIEESKCYCAEIDYPDRRED